LESRARTQKPSFPYGTGIPEKSGWPQIATRLILDGWQWNTGCTWMTGVERLGVYQNVDGAGTRAASAPTVKGAGKNSNENPKKRGSR
jgi:hypothetical protein